MSEINPAIINGIIIAAYIITLLILFGIKKRIKEELVTASTYFMIAISLLIVIRIVDALIILDIFYVPFLQETMVLALALFLLMVAIRLYRYVKESGEAIKE